MPMPLKDSFNEAGADCPGMLNDRAKPENKRTGFNEAGADCPGMPGWPSLKRR